MQRVILTDYDGEPVEFQVSLNDLLSTIQSEEGYEKVSHLVLDPEGSLSVYFNLNGTLARVEYWVARLEGSGINNSWASDQMPGGYEFCGSKDL